MAKHDRARKEKQQRNAAYGLRFKQRKCRTCGHKSSRRGNCILCGNQMK